MPCVWSKAEYIDGFVRSLAQRHGLAVFVPQTGKIDYPDSSVLRLTNPEVETKPWWKFW